MYFIAWLTGGKHFQLYLWSVQYWQKKFLSRSLHASCWRDLIEIKNQIQYIKSLEMSDNLWPVTRKSIYGNEHISINSTVQKQNKTNKWSKKEMVWERKNAYKNQVRKFFQVFERAAENHLNHHSFSIELNGSEATAAKATAVVVVLLCSRFHCIDNPWHLHGTEHEWQFDMLGAN